MAINYKFLLFSSLYTFLVVVYPTQAIQQGFTTNLIHHESPRSPHYNPSLTRYERLRNSISRSISRISKLETNLISQNDAESNIKLILGEYLIELSIGTPPVPQLCIADTGSDLIWTQCQPCQTCFKQDPPLIDPTKSSTYKLPSCGSQECKNLGTRCTLNNTCQYNYSYGDNSYSIGVIATETITFNADSAPKLFPNMIIGCGHRNSLTINTTYGSGIVGLGGGPLSFVSQLGPSIPKKFSYCLMNVLTLGNVTSKIKFGTSGGVSGPGVISTPIKKSYVKTFYYLNLEAISVGTVKIPFPSSQYPDVSEGNIFIDSGSTITQLPSEVYAKLSATLQESIRGQKIEDPNKLLDLCYKTSKDGSDLNIPNVTFHFEGGDLELKYTNTFVPISDDIVCLFILPANPVVVFGYLSTVNYLVGYDIEQHKVSFKPTDCMKE